MICVDTTELRELARRCADDAAGLNELAGSVDRAWGAPDLPPQVAALRGECDDPLRTVRGVAAELEEDARALRRKADLWDGIEENPPWVPGLLPPIHPYMPWNPRPIPLLPLVPHRPRRADGCWPVDRAEPPIPTIPLDVLKDWVVTGAGLAWGAVQTALDAGRRAVSLLERILDELIEGLRELADGFVRTADTLQREAKRWCGSVVDAVVGFPDDWRLWVDQGRYEGAMVVLGPLFDWIGKGTVIGDWMGELPLFDDSGRPWFEKVLLDAIPLIGDARGAFRLGEAVNRRDWSSAAWEAAALALPFLGGASLTHAAKYTKGSIDNIVLGVAGVAGKHVVPKMQTLWDHGGDIVDMVRYPGRFVDEVGGWAKDRWNDFTNWIGPGIGWVEKEWQETVRRLESGAKELLVQTDALARAVGRDSAPGLASLLTGGTLVEGSWGKSVRAWGREGRIGDDNLGAEGSIELLQAGAHASGSAGFSGQGFGADAAVGLEANLVRLRGSGHAQKDFGAVTAFADGEAEAMVGAEARAEGHLRLSPRGVDASGNAGAFVGGKVTGDVHTGARFAGNEVKVGAEGGVSYGLGAEVKGSAGFEGGKFKLSGKAGLSVGLGVEVGVNVEVDVSGALKGASDVAAAAGRGISGAVGKLASIF